MAHELKRTLEYADLAATPDDGKRYELVRGSLLVTPSPTPLHLNFLCRAESRSTVLMVPIRSQVGAVNASSHLLALTAPT